MPESNHAVRVEHRIAAKLSEVPLERAPASSPQEHTGVEPNGAEVQQAEPPTAEAPPAVGGTLRIDPDLEGGEPWLKRPRGFCRGGECDDDDPR